MLCICRQAYAGALPAELKVHRDFSDPLRWALKNGVRSAHRTRLRSHVRFARSIFSLAEPTKKCFHSFRRCGGEFCEALSSLRTLKTEQSNFNMPRKRLHIS